MEENKTMIQSHTRETSTGKYYVYHFYMSPNEQPVHFFLI